MPLRPFSTVREERPYACRIFKVRIEHSRSDPEKPPHPYHVLEMPGWINVLPITPEGEVVLIRQYRHGIGEFTLEIPGGMMDPSDPDPAAAAARELAEETGYVADRLVPLGRVSPNPAIQDNWLYTFAALDARPTGQERPDEGEEIEVELHPLDALPSLVMEGRVHHALVVSALYLFERWRAGR